ncbi:MAG: hypothetical protein RJA70_1532, partial [Pseudomonadota bacterium]
METIRAFHPGQKNFISLFVVSPAPMRGGLWGA